MASKIKDLSSYANRELPDGGDYSFSIVVAEWNPEVTRALLEGALNTLKNNGVNVLENVTVQHVPGSFELPQAASMMIDSFHPDAVICLGCIIQGETRHFEFIAHSVAQACQKLSLDSDVPVIFGVLTTDNHEQAKERAGGKHGNKGAEAAAAALEMANMRSELTLLYEDFYFDEDDFDEDDDE